MAGGGGFRDTVVAITTGYDLEGLGFEIQCGQKVFSSPSPFKLAVGSNQPTVEWVLGCHSGSRGQGMSLVTHSDMAPSLRMSRAKPPLSA